MEPSPPPPRILIVDDQPANVRLLERILEQDGHAEYRSVTDPLKAEAVFREYAPDLVLLDLMMTPLDGLGVMGRLRPLVGPGDYLPILVLTADTSPDARRQALAAGAKDFLTKPLDNLEVLLRIRNLLQTRTLYRQLWRQNQGLEEAVRQRTEALREQARLMDLARDAMIVRDLEDRVVYWNEGAERLYGWTSAEALGRPTNELFARGADPAAEEPMRTALAQRGEWAGEIKRVRKDGREVVVLARRSVVVGDDGRPRAEFSIHTDITDRKALEKQLLRAQRLESIGALAGGIAHDLNNMLTPILLGLGMLKESVHDALSGTLLEAMRTSAECGRELIRQILTFVRGAGDQQRELVLPAYLKEVASLVGKTFPREIEVRLDITPALWSVRADVTQLHQVLMNLCINARDAMPAGGRLTLSAANRTVGERFAARPEARPGRYVALAVEDTGTGIAPEVMGRLFEPFFTTKEPGKGTGLGLSTTAAIAQAHGGFVLVDSEPGRGSRFEVFLPAVDRAGRAAAAAAAPTPPEGRGELVLVVDDEASIREITRTTLELSGYRVLTAQDGAEAVALYTQHAGQTRAVLMDMVMPVMDGPSAIRALARVNPAVRVLAVSGAAEPTERTHEAYRGARAHLVKPFTAQTLLTTLRQVLDAPA